MGFKARRQNAPQTLPDQHPEFHRLPFLAQVATVLCLSHARGHVARILPLPPSIKVPTFPGLWRPLTSSNRCRCVTSGSPGRSCAARVSSPALRRANRGSEKVNGMCGFEGPSVTLGGLSRPEHVCHAARHLTAGSLGLFCTEREGCLSKPHGST